MDNGLGAAGGFDPASPLSQLLCQIQASLGKRLCRGYFFPLLLLEHNFPRFFVCKVTKEAALLQRPSSRCSPRARPLYAVAVVGGSSKALEPLGAFLISYIVFFRFCFFCCWTIQPRQNKGALIMSLQLVLLLMGSASSGAGGYYKINPIHSERTIKFLRDPVDTENTLFLYLDISQILPKNSTHENSGSYGS